MFRDFFNFSKLLVISLASLFLASCEPGCVENYEFSSESFVIDSKPDGVFGDYDSQTGGQIANVVLTGLRTNGEQIIVKITGGWTAWDVASSDSDLTRLPNCDICVKKHGVSNCICRDGEQPSAEPFQMDGIPNSTSINCSGANQDNPDLCTCTQNHGLASDDDVFYIATNYQNKTEVDLVPDDQNPCRYHAGMGAYIGLYGAVGNDTPLRMYHLYDVNNSEVCDVSRNSDGECLDDDGNDITQYIYKSPNDKIFIKDNKSGNVGIDYNTSDDEYHEAGEIVKMILYDSYYSDNYGYYNIEFLGGVLKQNDEGILEYIVGIFEDFVIGKVDEDGQRKGGALELLYNSLVQDSVFIQIIRLALISYITFFGFGILIGTVEISRKEMSSRVIKIALVMFFTTSTSWYWYNNLVVGLFKDGVDSIIAMFMTLIDNNISHSTITEVRSLDGVATRFAYIDYIIDRLLSAPVHKKIWGLFFGDVFGFLYILAIYGLIFFFMYVVLTAGIVYIFSLIKLILGLVLGPLFVLFSLFKRSDNFFKQWLSFLAARGMEIIILFLVIYTFLLLIDSKFTELLYFRSCTDTLDFGIIKFDILAAAPNRSLAEWFNILLALGGLIFLLKVLIEKIPQLSSNLISISGVDTAVTGATNASKGFFVANFRDNMLGAILAGVNQAKPYAYAVARGLNNSRRFAARKSGLTDRYNKIVDKIPLRGLASRRIDDIIKQSQENLIQQGFSGKELDRRTRESVVKYFQNFRLKSPNEANLLDLSTRRVTSRLDKKLFKDPVKEFVKNKAKELKKTRQNLYGSALESELRSATQKYVNNNFNVSEDSAQKLISGMGNLFDSNSQLNAKQAARRLSEDAEKQNDYLEYLNRRSAQKKAESQKSFVSKAKRGVGKLAKSPAFVTRKMFGDKNLDDLSKGIKDSEIGKSVAEFDSKIKNAKSVKKIADIMSTKHGVGNYLRRKSDSEKFLKASQKIQRDKYYESDRQHRSQVTKNATRFDDWAANDHSQTILGAKPGIGGEYRDQDYLKSAKEVQNKVSGRFKKTLNARLQDEMDSIRKDYKKQLQKYGYIKDAYGKMAQFSAIAPSRKKLEKQAILKLDALSKRLKAIDTHYGKDDLRKSLATVDGAKKMFVETAAKKITDKEKLKQENLDKLPPIFKEVDQQEQELANLNAKLDKLGASTLRDQDLAKKESLNKELKDNRKKASEKKKYLSNLHKKLLQEVINLNHDIKDLAREKTVSTRVVIERQGRMDLVGTTEEVDDATKALEQFRRDIVSGNIDPDKKVNKVKKPDDSSKKVTEIKQPKNLLKDKFLKPIEDEIERTDRFNDYDEAIIARLDPDLETYLKNTGVDSFDKLSDLQKVEFERNSNNAKEMIRIHRRQIAMRKTFAEFLKDIDLDKGVEDKLLDDEITRVGLINVEDAAVIVKLKSVVEEDQDSKTELSDEKDVQQQLSDRDKEALIHLYEQQMQERQEYIKLLEELKEGRLDDIYGEGDDDSVISDATSLESKDDESDVEATSESSYETSSIISSDDEKADELSDDGVFETKGLQDNKTDSRKKPSQDSDKVKDSQDLYADGKRAEDGLESEGARARRRDEIKSRENKMKLSILNYQLKKAKEELENCAEDDTISRTRVSKSIEEIEQKIKDITRD